MNEIFRMYENAAWLNTPDAVRKIRLAALLMLAETEGRPTRIVVDVERLIAEARAL